MTEFRIQYEDTAHVFESDTWEETLEAAKQTLLRNGEGTVNIQERASDGRWDSIAYLKLKFVG